MEHHFDVDIAEKYGLLEAILLNNFAFWVAKNKANNTNYHDGYYWTYNSTKALTELFPYASNHQIRRALEHLQNEGLILTGNYNETSYDRTMWYTLTEAGLSICQNCNFHLPNLENGFAKIEQPIPYIKPYINTDIKKDTKKEVDESQQVVDMYHEECPSLPKVRSLSDTRKKHILARLKEHSMDELRLAFQKAEASDWCTGRSGGWKCNLEWMMKSENNLLKILEGNYDNRNSIKEKTISDMRKITEGMTAEEYAEMEKEFR